MDTPDASPLAWQHQFTDRSGRDPRTPGPRLTARAAHHQHQPTPRPTPARSPCPGNLVSTTISGVRVYPRKRLDSGRPCTSGTLGGKPANATSPTQPIGGIEAKPLSLPKPRAGKPRTERRPDRLRAALRKLPGSFSSAMAARAAGLNTDKTIVRLHDLERRGEVRRVGNRWSTEPRPDDVALAMDRLQARTNNLRIVKDRARVG